MIPAAACGRKRKLDTSRRRWRSNKERVEVVALVVAVAVEEELKMGMEGLAAFLLSLKFIFISSQMKGGRAGGDGMRDGSGGRIGGRREALLLLLLLLVLALLARVLLRPSPLLPMEAAKSRRQSRLNESLMLTFTLSLSLIE